MVGHLGEFVPPFRPTFRGRGNCITTIRWQDIGAGSLVQTLGSGPIVGSPRSSSTLLSIGRSRLATPPPRHYAMFQDYKITAIREVSIWTMSIV